MNIVKWCFIGFAAYCVFMGAFVAFDYWRFCRTGKTFFNRKSN